jgi:glucose-1-phosphate cytidylyltransferase
MKVVILAGGFGTRLSEETGIRPKPMVEIGGMPILWHIMKSYSSYGFNDFIICLGYKGFYIKEFFADYFLRVSSVCFDMKNNKMEVLSNNIEPWKVTLVDTGENTQMAGRLKRIEKYVGQESFMFTYGDGVSDVNINQLIEFHKKQNTYATLTAVQPPGRFGVFSLEDNVNIINSFQEKPKNDHHDTTWVNGGFFVMQPEVFSLIDGDSTMLEKVLDDLTQNAQLSAYRHKGFWQNMDTLPDKEVLNKIWEKGNAPWKNW